MIMCYYIGIEDLAANGLIESLKKGNRRFLSYEEIEEYGSKVVQILYENGEKAILILSRDKTTAFFRNYSKFFTEKEKNGVKGIALQENVKIEDLIGKFRGYLALNVLLAFVNAQSTSVLGV